MAYDDALAHTSPRPDGRRLRLGAYPYVIDIRIRFSDLDPLGHLNNVALNEYYEETRVSMHHLHLQFVEPEGPIRRALVTQNTLHYIAEGTYPGTLTVGAGIARAGRTSYVVSSAIFQGAVCIGICDTLMVVTDDDGPAVLTDRYRALLEEMALRPA